MEVIKIDHLTKTYKDVIAVNDLSININEGEIYALLGVNGAGKTTTIKMLATLTTPTSGDAYIFNNSIKDNANEVKKLIDISMQETSIARNLTVKENLEFYASIRGLEKEEMKNRIEEIIKDFSFDEILNKKAKKLSGGWQRKLSIALGIISKPKVLFLDEPTLGLDVLARRDLWHLIEKLKGKMTIILTTHYMEEAEHLADRIGIMKKGRLLISDTLEVLKNKTNTTNLEDAFINIIEKGENN